MSEPIAQPVISEAPELTVQSPQRVNIQIEHRSQTPILEAVGLGKVYVHDQHAVTPLKDASFRIAYGEFVIIFGPSGAGKSTLMNALIGIEPPDVGQVLLKDQSFYSLSQERRGWVRLQRFGYIPQRQYWVDQYSVLDNIGLPLLLAGRTKKAARKAAAEVMEQTGIEDLAKQSVTNLSLGQQQKVALARSLVNDPWIIFADEPTEHLDTQSAAGVVETLQQANQSERRTVIMITHNLHYLSLATKWLFMQDGQLYNIPPQPEPFASIKEAREFCKKMTTAS